MDFMRIYAQLASKVQPIMLKSTAHPTARHASQLLTPTPSMGEQERAAIEQLLLHRSSSATSDGGASASSGSQSLGLETRFEAATLGSVPEGLEAAGCSSASASPDRQHDQQQQRGEQQDSQPDQQQHKQAAPRQAAELG